MGRLMRTGLPGLIFVIASFVFAGPAKAGLGVGDSVEAFSVEKSGGGKFQYPEDAKDKVVFLNFWASWCPECKVELPELVKIQEKYEDRPFALLAVNMDRKRKAADKFLEKAGLDVLVLYDNEQKVINAFAPVGVPASYLIGPDGKVDISICGDQDYHCLRIKLQDFAQPEYPFITGGNPRGEIHIQQDHIEFLCMKQGRDLVRRPGCPDCPELEFQGIPQGFQDPLIIIDDKNFSFFHNTIV